MDQFAQACTYTTIGATITNIDAIVGDETVQEIRRSDGRWRIRRRLFEISLADIPNPSTDDKIAIDATAEAWEIESIGNKHDGMVSLMTFREELIEKSLGEFRINTNGRDF